MVNIYTCPAGPEPLGPQSSFRFHCHPGLSCFTRCCQEPTIILQPYDILRLCRRLGLASTAFLARYTMRTVEEASGLPLRLLARQDGPGGGCPFLAAGSGCSVYEDRPAACRLFPVVQGSNLRHGQPVPVYYLKNLDYCQGLAEGPVWTLEQWRQDQGLPPYEAHNDSWAAILLQQGAKGPANLAQARLWELALYDLDGFRSFVLESAFAQTFGLSEAAKEVLDRDDTALLQVGYAYVRRGLGLAGAGELEELLATWRRGA